MRLLVLVSLLVFVLAAPTLAEDFLLRDVTPQTAVDFASLSGSPTRKELIVEQLTGGGALFDYDGDGDLDLYIVNGADLAIARGEKEPVHNALYRNDGMAQLEHDGRGVPRFVDVTQRAGVGDPGWGIGAAVADADGDGDLDLYVTNWGSDVLYENAGDGTFRDVTRAAGLGDPGMGASAVFADVDGDGAPDLYVTRYLELDLARPPQGGEPCLYDGLPTACGPVGLPPQADRLYRNESGTHGIRFRDVSEEYGVHAPEPQYGLGVIAADLDRDGFTDLFVANDSGPNFLFRNRGDAEGPGSKPRFEELAWLTGLATQGEGRFQAGMGVALGDADGDGRLDLFLTHFSRDHNTLYLDQGELVFRDASYPSGLGGPSRPFMGWGTRFVDFDQDGDLDLYVANGHIYPEVDAAGRESFAQPDLLFLNDGQGRFSDASERLLRATRVGRGVSSGDFDGDLDVDLVVFEMGARPSLLRRETPSRETPSRESESPGHFLVLDPRRLRPAEGTRVSLAAGGRRQVREVSRGGSYASASDARLYFGLGAARRVDEVRVERGAKARAFRGLAADHGYVLPAGGMR